ncbi:MAG: GNAT family N-acetyltransferase [Deltaproteobacteria bacterium]|nr:GNAT family N-acetyltransferase [Deltaproteobacteria bacterium]
METGIQVVRAQTPEQKELCYKVRYDVFIKETGYIQMENGAGLESDGYDSLETTHQFLALFNGEIAGAVRLIMPNKENALRERSYFGLPIEELFDIKGYTSANMRIAEISRSCVKERFKSTKTIFYLWKALIEFAVGRGITDLVTNVNPETDKLSDAYLIYDHIRHNGMLDKRVAVQPKRPGIGKVRGFRFPLTDHGYVECDGEKPMDFQMPQTLKLFTRVGSLFTGEPVYCEKIDMCALPMNWNLKEAANSSFGRSFLRDRSYKRPAEQVA